MFLIIALFGSCVKNSLVEIERNQEGAEILRRDLKNETRKLSSFIDKYTKTSNMVKSSHNGAQLSMQGIVSGYIRQELSHVEALAIDQYVVEVSPYFNAFATSNQMLPLLSEAPTQQAATTLIKTNLRQSTNLTEVVPSNDNKLKDVITSLHGEINDEIENDIVNAYLIEDENMSVAQIERLYESHVATIKDKVSSKIINFNSALLVNSRGLTRQQVSMVGVTGMVALEAIDDAVLMENLEEMVSASLVFDESISIVVSKGLFKKIGKFFTKVIKTVAVVVTYVAVAAITVYNAALTITESGYSSGSAAFKTLLGAGAMANLATSWKKSWKWVGWDNWSKW